MNVHKVTAKDMEEMKTTINSLRLLIRLPIWLYFRGQAIYPRPPQNGYKLPDLSHLPIKRGYVSLAQHTRAMDRSRYIFVELDDEYAIVMGPYLHESDEVNPDYWLRQGIYDLDAGEQASQMLNSLDRISYDSAVIIGRYLAEFSRTVVNYIERQEAVAHNEGTLNAARLEQVRAQLSNNPQNAIFGLAAHTQLFFEAMAEASKEQEEEELGSMEDSATYLSTSLPERYYRTQLEDRAAQFSHSDILLEEEMSKGIADGEVEVALKALKQINNQEKAKLSQNPLRSLKNSLIGSITIFTRAAIRGGVDYASCFTLSDAYIRQIDQARSEDDLDSIEERALRDFTGLVSQEQENQQRYNQTVLQIMKYINANLVDDLSLDALAQVFHLHPAYLSKLFKQETGEGVNRFIRAKRLEEAASMLKYTNNSIQDIAEFYRFSSQSHFTRQFKEHFGVPPARWRREANREKTRS